ncbi:MAG: hypothetical protein ACRCW9_04060 [Cetobacterium sp.]
MNDINLSAKNFIEKNPKLLSKELVSNFGAISYYLFNANFRIKEINILEKYIALRKYELEKIQYENYEFDPYRFLILNFRNSLFISDFHPSFMYLILYSSNGYLNTNNYIYDGLYEDLELVREYIILLSNELGGLNE